ncbi:hypothetical protein [Polaribacter dokdonensis]|uniref:Uncharacterized protein n=1 Tax=Polaribacter dokdonensis DSW-5 TaxID=1300348 RepID=A0A0M9CHN5_9FLAO|nr:hypothetical protein [Polaribacter dokdonensis]KOY52831.1 hypothetical protein I602_2391 [Polaribacter dokdonensis DSW-5]SEE53086.1 hypothetical protein SAMN05444353_2166 [Polaribacter dokdonensis DSW-5]
MQQDIRDKFKNYKEENVELSKNHSIKFEALLQQELHQNKPKKNYIKWLSVAASVMLLVSIGIQFYPNKTSEPIITKNDNDTTTKQITLGNISPEFNTIETYYTNSINLEISQLDLSDENKELVDSYLLKIAELTKEYKNLTQELNTKGVNDATIDALIRNLQLRLQLLQRLKKQLNEFKNLNTKQNELQII